jgi:LmbE family N-acetylglucosaminyl deacetylase
MIHAAESFDLKSIRAYHRAVQARFRVAALIAALGGALTATVAAAPGALDADSLRHARLLVISPHPDDGTLGAGGLIARVAAAGGDVRLVQMTSGDAFANGVKLEARVSAPTPDDYRRYGAIRERESVAAMSALGVRRRSITFLGFPDDGLCRLASDFHTATSAFESPYTKRESPPAPEQLVSGVEYRGDDAQRELQRVLVTFAPTIVMIPDPHDEHPDHCSTHLLAHEALDDARAANPRLAPRVLHYLIHYGAWPAATVDAAGAATVTPPLRLQTADAHWIPLALTPAESAAKKRALAAFQSQMLAIGPFLESFERPGELYAEGDADAAVACWCRGQDVAASRWSEHQRRTLAKP